MTTRRIRSLAGVLAGLMPLAAPAGSFRFTDVTADAGILHTHSHPANSHPHGFSEQVAYMSGGAAGEDFNGDGRIDLYVLQGGASPNLMYINQGDGVFTNEAARRGADLVHYGMGVAAADYDNDGDVDIVITVRHGEPVLLRNTGGGFFSQASIGPEPVLLEDAMSPGWGDIDNDGNLELLLGQWEYGSQGLHLYLNQGGELVPAAFRLAPFQDRLVFTPRFADLNQDRRADLPVVCDFERSQLYLNLGEKTFARVTAASGVSLEKNGMGSALGDIDNDGDLDWFASSIGAPSMDPGLWQVGNRLYRNRGNGAFDDVTAAAGVQDGNWGWGSAFGDLDNDGDLDLYHVNGWPGFPPGIVEREQFIDQPARLFENLGAGSFTNVAAGTGADHPGQGRGVLLADYDGDGDLDIFICNNMVATPNPMNVIYTPGIPALLRNDGPRSNHWLQVTLEGIPPHHRNGIGSRVYVTTGNTVQMRELDACTGFLSQGPGRIAHFGLGNQPVADEVRAEWNTGNAVIRWDVAADQRLSLPSPGAVLSARRVMPGQVVTATAPAGTGPAEWVVDGKTHADPVTVAFAAPGIYELTLIRFHPDGETRSGAEILRVQVIEIAPSDIVRTSVPGHLAIGWETVPGRLYGLHSVPALSDGTWAAAAPPVMAAAGGRQIVTVTNATPTTGYYRVTIDPVPEWPVPD